MNWVKTWFFFVILLFATSAFAQQGRVVFSIEPSVGVAGVDETVVMTVSVQKDANLVVDVRWSEWDSFQFVGFDLINPGLGGCAEQNVIEPGEGALGTLTPVCRYTLRKPASLGQGDYVLPPGLSCTVPGISCTSARFVNQAPSQPPALAFSPASGSTLAFSASGAPPSLLVTPSGGAGAGVATVGPCTISGGGQAFPTTSVPAITIQPGSAARALSLPACVPQPAAASSATLTCPVQAGAASAATWPLSCPQSTADGSVGTGPGGEQTIRNALERAAQTVNDPVAAVAAAPVAAVCANAALAGQGGAARDACLAITGAAEAGRSSDTATALRSLASEESLAVSETALATYRQRSTGTVRRLAEVRGGGGRGANLAGLNLIDGNGVISAGLLTQAMGMLILSGTDLDQPAGGQLAEESDWGFFVNGTYARQQTSARGSNVGFDLDGYNVQLGVDRRLGDLQTPTVLGIAVNLSSGKTNFDNEDTARLDTGARALLFYGTKQFSNGGYLDGAITFGRFDFDQLRDIDLRSVNAGRFLARGETDGNERALALSFGMPLTSKGPFTFTPSVGLNWSKISIDSFSESDAGSTRDNIWVLRFPDQEVKSVLGNVAMRAERVWQIESRGQPLGVAWYGLANAFFELSGDGSIITPTLPRLGDIPLVPIQLEDVDNRYYTLETGLAWQTVSGWQFYFSGGGYAGLRDTRRYYLNVGGRFDF
jgi:hypothetical protein